MTSVLDLWRAVDAEAALLGGERGIRSPVRGVQRTRAVAPHLPPAVEAALLVADSGVIGSADELLSGLRAAELAPAAVMMTGGVAVGERVESAVPLLASQLPIGVLVERASAYLADEPAWLARVGTEMRLLCAEAALSEPDPSTPAGLIAGRIGRGVAVSADGELRALHARSAGRALAARFAALHARLLAGGGQHGQAVRRSREGLWLLERRIRPGATLWVFDDLPFAAIDEVAADAAAATLRALLRRRPAPEPEPRRRTPVPPPASPAPEVDGLTATLLAVARHNGRVAPAARELGVHRNTVLYRLRRAAAERGLDPRRPEDALRILSAERGR